MKNRNVKEINRNKTMKENVELNEVFRKLLSSFPKAGIENKETYQKDGYIRADFGNGVIFASGVGNNPFEI